MAKRQRAYEIGLLLAIVIFAAALRLWNLSQLPVGFHGDEALVGLEARRVWRENGIGVYTSAALGQPTGPLYFVALSLRVFGDSIFAVRFASALAGIATIVVCYFFARRFFDYKIALLSAFLLSICNWHLHFSRIGFPVAAWPLFVLLGAWFLLEAIERRRILWWFFAGASAGGGLYVYNAHFLFLAIACLFALWHLARQETSKETREKRVFWACVFFGALIFVALPMIFYALKPENNYASHFRLYSLFERDEWLKASPPLRFSLLGSRYFDFWNRLCWQPRVDYADGTGLVAQMPIFVVALAFFGAFHSWKTRFDSAKNACAKNAHAINFLVLLLLFFPLASVFTIDGALRRTLALAPILAIFAAHGLCAVWCAVRNRQPRLALPLKIALAGLLLFIGVQSARDYFGKFAQSPYQAWGFGDELKQASLYMRKLPPAAHVYFFSERWPENYAPRPFLAPSVWIEDRSAEHGVFNLDNDSHDTDSVWMLLGDYQKFASRLRVLHPGGELIEGPLLTGTNQKCFVVYRVRMHSG